MRTDDVRPPSWGVVLACVAVACWVAAASLTSSAVSRAPRRVVSRRRPRYIGTHGKGRVIA